MSKLPKTGDNPLPGAPARQPQATQPDHCGGQPATVEPHEPPIIIGGGSLYIDLPGNKTLNEPTPNLALPRPFRHGFMGGGEGSVLQLEFLHVLTQLRDHNGQITFTTHPVTLADNGALQIFLSQQRGDGTNNFDPVHATEPQLVIAGNPFRLELDKQLRGPARLPKTHNPLRYDHPGYTRSFRIEGWRIVNTAGGVINPGSTGAESYWFALSFAHPH